MKTFYADRNEAFKERVFTLPPVAQVRCRYPAGTACTVTALDEEGTETEIANIAAATEFVEHYRLHGFAALSITSKKKMAVEVVIREKQEGEPLNNEPPPEPVQPDNVLQRIRSNVRHQMGIQREAFLENRTGFRGYEIDDDEPWDFEEELMQKVEKAQKEAEEKAALKEKEKAKSNDENSSNSDRDISNPDDSVSGAQSASEAK